MVRPEHEIVQMDQQLYDAIWHFIHEDAAARDKDAERRHKELLAVLDREHKELLAVVQKGFAQVADAIRRGV